MVSTKLDICCYLIVQRAPAMCRRFDTVPACDRQTDKWTDGQTDGIAVASTALAMRALRHAVKTLQKHFTESQCSVTLAGEVSRN